MRGALGILLAAATVAAPGWAQPFDIAGTWYVLVHYKDDAAGNPDAERWDDRVWVFERKGSRMRWTEYPIAVFREHGISLSINTDDPGPFLCNMNSEVALIAETFNFTADDFHRITADTLAARFAPDLRVDPL